MLSALSIPDKASGNTPNSEEAARGRFLLIIVEPKSVVDQYCTTLLRYADVGIGSASLMVR